MSWTVNAHECTRVTVVNESGLTVYDYLVKPLVPIVDYMTEFSGIDEAALRECATKSLVEVQQDLMELLSADSILIGHGLHCDLKALKLFHNRIVDSSIHFATSLVPLLRKKLVDLSMDHLGWLIQKSPTGHNSAEDARASLEVIRHVVESKQCAACSRLDSSQKGKPIAPATISQISKGRTCRRIVSSALERGPGTELQYSRP
ncbi:Hypothetical predicted protein [Cloeon dipterum]|uniref:Exonuclease domain-containing protein n=1 Tax=Cloeon dipterum TaxID=197152 RepID=A0A8S1CNB6_9INSE|nr:Hypothetical predicted protein [Cloeon dipterum]